MVQPSNISARDQARQFQAANEESLSDYFAEEIHAKEYIPVCLLGCGAAGTELAGTFRLKPDYVPAYLPKYYPVRAIAMDTQANISDLLKRAVGWYEPEAQLHMNPPDESLIEALLEQGATQQITPGEFGEMPSGQAFERVGRSGGAGGFTLRGRATSLYHFGSDTELRRINTEILERSRLLSRANSGYLLTFSGLGGGTGSGAVPVVVSYIQQRMIPSPVATFSVCVVPEATSGIMATDDSSPRDPRLLSNLVCALYYLATSKDINGIILSDNLQIESQGHKGFSRIDRYLQDVLMPVFLSGQSDYVYRTSSAQLDPVNLKMVMSPGDGGTQDFIAACYSVCPVSQSRRQTPGTGGSTVAPDPDSGVPDLQEMLDMALRNPTIQCETSTARGVLALLSGPEWALQRMMPDVTAQTFFDKQVLFPRCIDRELQTSPDAGDFSRFFVACFPDMTDVRLTVLLRAPRIRSLENAFQEALRNEAPDWVPGVRGGTLADALRRVDESTIRRVGWAHATTGR